MEMKKIRTLYLLGIPLLTLSQLAMGGWKCGNNDAKIIYEIPQYYVMSVATSSSCIKKQTIRHGGCFSNLGCPPGDDNNKVVFTMSFGNDRASGTVVLTNDGTKTTVQKQSATTDKDGVIKLCQGIPDYGTPYVL